MSVLIETRDQMISDIKDLKPGSVELLNQTQAIKIMSDIDRDDRKLDFEEAKEETRKLEKSNETVYSSTELELRKIELAINAINVILNPGSLVKTILNNHTRVKRDVMGYEFETTGVIGSHTFNNAQKDKYD